MEQRGELRAARPIFQSFLRVYRAILGHEGEGGAGLLDACVRCGLLHGI